MISWTLATRPDQQPTTLTAAGAELDRTAAVGAAADALRSALMDARSLVSDHRMGPAYTVTIDGDCALVLGTGGTHDGGLDLDVALDEIARFDGSAPPYNLLA